jgi:hypothetical protein
MASGDDERLTRESARVWAKERGFVVLGNEIATVMSGVEVHVHLYHWPPILVTAHASEAEPVRLSIEPKDWADRIRERVWPSPPITEDDAFEASWRITANNPNALVRLVNERCRAVLMSIRSAEVWCRVEYVEGDVHIAIDPPEPTPRDLLLAIELAAVLACSRTEPSTSPYR